MTPPEEAAALTPHVVEVRIPGQADDLSRLLASWEWLLDRLAASTSSRVTLLGMPAVTGERSPEGDEVLLRWVGIHATDAVDALAQITGVLHELSKLLPALGSEVVRSHAHPEAT